VIYKLMFPQRHLAAIIRCDFRRKNLMLQTISFPSRIPSWTGRASLRNFSGLSPQIDRDILEPFRSFDQHDPKPAKTNESLRFVSSTVPGAAVSFGGWPNSR